MEILEQGTIIHLEGQRTDSLVLSRSFYNRTGMIIAAPVYPKGEASVLHIPVTGNEIQGIVHLEAMKGLDISARYYTMRAKLSMEQIQNISDTVQGVFDYL